MTVRTRLPLVLAVVGMVVVSGCTVPSAGTPQPASSTQPSLNDLPSDGAPKVETPLGASHFEQKPCDTLKPEDAKTLNIPPDGEQQKGDTAGEWCIWTNRDTGGSLGVAFFSGDKRGLSSVYKQAHGSQWAYFEPIDDVEGHPAIAFDTTHRKPEDECSVVVGLTDELAFMTRVALSDANIGKSDPCPLTAKAAGMLLRTMREAA
jgi:uncharacterized protein DUF3558